MSRCTGSLFTLVLSLAALALAACPQQPSPTGCEGWTCSGHGTCSSASGSTACACEMGYQGAFCELCAAGYKRAGEACVAADTCQPTSCSGHGTCDDSSGTLACTCATGWAGARCDACAAGLQDHDGDGTCRPDCATAGLSCVHGQCSDERGVAACACAEGYAGERCEGCAAGYQDQDADGACRPDCTRAPLDCGAHGTCDDRSGAAACACDAGYQGAACLECAQGFQDRDGDGSCLPGCGGLSVNCSGHGTCDDQTGTALCACAAGYAGQACAACASGYQDRDGNGTCLVDCATAGLACGAHGKCDDGSGTAVCACATGYQGAACAGCASGYQDRDGNGTCLADCATSGLACGAHGHCDDGGGTAVCACATGYQGASCAQCATGYASDGAGGCVLAPANGHTCATAIPLPLVDGSVTGSTVGAGDEHQPSCLTSSSADSTDLVYVLSPTENLHVTLETSASFDTVLSLASSCSGQDLVCDDDIVDMVNSNSRIEYDLVAGSTYNVFVDGYGESGSFTLLVTATVICPAGQTPDGQGQCVDDPCLPDPCLAAAHTQCLVQLPGHLCQCLPGYVPDSSGPGCVVNPNVTGESCLDPIALSGQGTATGSTASAADDATGSCGGSGGKDRVYTFAVSSRTRYEFTLQGFDSVLHLRSTCSTFESELDCNDDYAGAGGPSQLVGVVPPGTYYLFADGYDSTGSGPYTLSYTLTADPCAADPCLGVQQCVTSDDFLGYQCVCPVGTLPDGGACVDDPCLPNPCTAAHKNRCTPQLPGAYQCQCNPGYLDDGAGGCTADPNSNRWTLLVYMNGDNSLAQDALDDLAEMQTAGSNADVDIVVLHDGDTDGDTQLLRVVPGGTTVLQNKGELDMGDWRTLRDFGTWGVQNFPAEHFALVLWDHGDGWRSAAPRPRGTLKAFSNDDHGNPDGISIANGDYARALEAIRLTAGRKLDLVGFDACLMGMYEVAKATAPYADYLVASEETEPNPGWLYDQFLLQLVGNYTMGAEALGRLIVDSYYAASAEDSTLALSNLGTLPALDTALSSFADALRADSALYSRIGTQRDATQSFDDDTHRDLRDFASRVAVMAGASATLSASANALVTQLQATTVYNKAQSTYPKAYGLAIYLPGRSDYYDHAYDDAGATWSAATTWDEFLRSFAQ